MDAAPVALLPNGFVHHQRAAMQRTPEHHLPVGAVPKPAKQHGEHEVNLGAHLSLAISAQWNIEIVP